MSSKNRFRVFALALFALAALTLPTVALSSVHQLMYVPSGTGITHITGGVQATAAAQISLTADVTGTLPTANGGRQDNSYSLLAAFTSTTATAAQATNLTCAVGTSQAVLVEGEGVWTASTTNGNKMALSIPGSATIEGQINCALASATGFTSSIITTGGALGVTCDSVASTALPYQFSARVKTASTSGNITFEVAPAATTGTTTVAIGSWMRCTTVSEL